MPCTSAFRTAYALAVPMILVGCGVATSPNAPSLLPRAIEKRNFAEPIVTAANVVPDAALDSRIADKTAAFDAAATAFDSARAGLAARITRARGTTQGADAWVDGQTAFGELQQLRTATDGAMAEIESLAIDRGVAGQPPYPRLEAAIAAAQVRLDSQVGIEERLLAALPN